MYQFYYADRAKSWPHTPCRQNIREQFEITAIRPAMWEEHCLECSAPYCFTSCVHYAARSDGRCKRFDNGLLTFPDEKACCGQGVHVKFRKWGNMMTVLFPAMLPEVQYQKLWKKNERLGKQLKCLESSKLPQQIRWQGIRVPEFIRRRSLRNLQGASNTADAFLFHGYSYSKDSFQLIVEIYDDHTPVYKTAMTVAPGENTAVLANLPPECSQAGNLVKIYPENNLEAELDILWCDFVQGHPVVSDKPAAKVKCVVWDLDNTLWDGTLIETDDPKTLMLKPGIREVMQKLDEKGILQSVASKNDHGPAMAVLEHLGIADYFLYPQIHWNPKSGSMEAIAKDLNIGIDTFAFVDDTPFERGEVHSTWPQVRTYETLSLDDLQEKAEFDVPITAESGKRRSMYQAEAKRNQLRSNQHTDIVAFLKKCNLSACLFDPGTQEEKLRCFELAVRTNQLNMSGKKYTPEEFDAVLTRPGHRNVAFSCKDDFGEYGIVGFAQYRVEKETLIFSEFAMSCRIAGKFVESAVFSHLLRDTCCKTGVFEVQITKKNILLRNSLEQIGFRVQQKSAERICYEYTVPLLNDGIVTVNRKENSHE